ncbi:MAG: TonB-dependent receptor [Cytophagales bacterium]|nr:TonB-dependent receptor [Cytophagales bacterium]
MSRIYSLLFFIIISSSLLNAQQWTISGIVKDSLDGEGLAGATVSINFGEMAIATDADGNFAVKMAQKEVNIIVRYVGYVPFRTTFVLNKNTRLDISLLKVSNQLNEVVISRAASQNIKRPLLGVSTLNIETVRKLPTALGEIDIMRGLQMLPGVSSVGEASNGVNIRGGTTDQNLMLLDGAPIFNPTHMFGLFSAFPSEAVSGFDLYKGTVPARYGGRAAAVLDVSLARPNLTKFSAEGGASFVSNRVKLDVPIIKDRLGIMVSGRGALNDWALPLVSEKLKEIKAKFYDGSAKLFAKINDKNTLSASAYYSNDFFQTDALNGIPEINATLSQYKYSTLNFSGTWFTAFSNNLNLQTTLVTSNYDPSILLPEFESENEVEIAQNIRYKQAKTNLNYYKGKHTIEFGLDATQYSINPGELIPGTSQAVNSIKTPVENGLELGLSLEDQIEISENLTLSAGVRYSDFRNYGPAEKQIYEQDKERTDVYVAEVKTYANGEVISNDGGLEPRVGLRLSLNKQSSIKIGYNLLRQYMQIISNTTTPIPTSRWKTSDIYIKPQVSSLYSVGYFKNSFDGVYEFSAEAYYRFTDNIIDYKPGADFLLNSNPETELLQGQNKSYGVELMVSKKKGPVAGWINYTFARSLNKVKEGNSFNQQINFGNWYAANYDKPHTVNASMIINQGAHHDFSFNFTYSTGRPYTTPQGFINFSESIYPFYSVRNNSRIPDYHRLDFSWNIYQPSMRTKRFKGNWNFTLYNLYARKNAYSVFFRNEGRVSKTYKLSVFGAPIVSLAYNFRFD